MNEIHQLNNNIDTVLADLDTLDNIILDDEEEDDFEEDAELTDMRHQLFEVKINFLFLFTCIP